MTGKRGLVPVIRAVVISLIMLVSMFPAAHGDGRDHISLDRGWLFSLGDHEGASKDGFEDSDWRQLHLPHDWSIEGAYDKDNPAGVAGGFLPTGTGWYPSIFSGAPSGRAASFS